MRNLLSNMDSTVILSILFATLCTVISIDRDGPHDLSITHLGWPVPRQKFPRSYYELYHDVEAWKRAPSAGFYGMRGKKVPSSNFFGMRGKKGPSGFLGMRGKKMDALRGYNNDLSPMESLNRVWTPLMSDGYVEGIKSYNAHGQGPAASSEDLLYETQQQSLGDPHSQTGDSESDTIGPEQRVKRSPRWKYE